MNPNPNPSRPREFITEPGALQDVALPTPAPRQPTPREALQAAYVATLEQAASLRRAMAAFDAAAQPTGQPQRVAPNWPI